MRTKLFFTSVAIAAAIWITDMRLEEPGDRFAHVPDFKLGPSDAIAQNGQARRTARRTSRRVTRRRTSIAGCTPYRAYYNCAGVYYAPVQEGGTTVYVVVNP
ncbi:MAG: hypothetical protein JJ866_17580 [Roseibium sp.]|uniref:hypothetical protein n=1 Tax=Roseibium sp. TaxID=1936156 RepID=UPI001B23205E|nr:hypothetical protein [Roseibium sp.]MBO6893758.1 hypothetical protein [Roseibium sp.]MBO6928579.1 hypothetical protein [Roseibium sp.]